MNEIDKIQLVVKSALAVEGRLSGQELEKIRINLRHNRKTFYHVIRDMEVSGVLKTVKKVQNVGSHMKPRYLVRTRGVTVPDVDVLSGGP